MNILPNTDQICIQFQFNHYTTFSTILKSHSLGYQFITNEGNQSNPEFFILIESLDGYKLFEESPDLFKDSITKSKDHFRFRPKIDSSFICELNMSLMIWINFETKSSKKKLHS